MELGALYRAQASSAKADEHLASAIALFDAMDMRRFAGAARDARAGTARA
jgi:hypothetical protein